MTVVDITAVWKKAQAHLAEKLGTTTLETWILPLKPRQRNKDTLSLEAPDIFFKDWVQRHYKHLIQEAINLSSPNQKIELSLESASATKEAPGKPQAQGLPPKPQENQNHLLLLRC